VAQVDRVSDGDTVIATSANGTKLRIRLLGIDPPEVLHSTKPGQPYGAEAHDYLGHLLEARRFWRTPVDRISTIGSSRFSDVLLGGAECQSIFQITRSPSGCAAMVGEDCYDDGGVCLTSMKGWRESGRMSRTGTGNAHSLAFWPLPRGKFMAGAAWLSSSEGEAHSHSPAQAEETPGS
jgi:hypothetical protein